MSDRADDALFFERLLGMDLREQEDLLRRRVIELKAQKMHFKNTDRRFHAIDTTQRKCEAELHRVSQVLNRARWSDAVRNVFGQEGYEAVVLEIERMAGYPHRATSTVTLQS